MKSLSPRELLLLCAPVLVLAGVGFWVARRPQPDPIVVPKWRIESKITRRNPFPFEVRRGADTCFAVSSQVFPPKGIFLNGAGTLWNDVRLIETDEKGRQTRVWNGIENHLLDGVEDYNSPKRRIFGGRGGGNAGSWRMDYGFALRHFPRPLHRLELRVDSVWRPVTTREMIIEATPGEIARMRAQRDALSSSKRLVLRELGQKTPALVASKDPMFDVRRVEVRAVENGNAFEVRWHAFWRGPRVNLNLLHSNIKELRVVDNKGESFSRHDNDLGLTSAINGRRFVISHEQELLYLRSRARKLGSKKLFLRGWISVGGRWPRQVNVPLPDWVLESQKPKPTLQNISKRAKTSNSRAKM